MAAFSYQALDASGKKVKGILEGDSAKQIRGLLREKKLKPLEVNPVAGKQEKQNNNSGFSRTRIKPQELSLVTRQLATLVESNLPLDEALHATAQQVKRNQVKSLLLGVRSKVLEGHALAYALEEFPRTFNELYCSMVRAGEHAGFLGLVLDRLADYTENRHHTQQQLQMAMIYPIVLIMVAFGVIGSLLVFVVPKLVRVFESNNAELPGLTKAMIAISDFVASYYFLGFIVALILGFIGFKYWLRSESNLKRYHYVLLKMPFIGNLLRTADSARFASTLSVLTASGVPLLDGLRIAGAVINNRVLREAAAEVANSVKEGSSLNKALARTEEFPPMMVHMVASGEASGELETMLERVARNQERELQTTLTTVMSIFEPLMVITMAGFVLLIVLAILLPIFGMNNLVQ